MEINFGLNGNSISTVLIGSVGILVHLSNCHRVLSCKQNADCPQREGIHANRVSFLSFTRTGMGLWGW